MQEDPAGLGRYECVLNILATSQAVVAVQCADTEFLSTCLRQPGPNDILPDDSLHASSKLYSYPCQLRALLSGTMRLVQVQESTLTLAEVAGRCSYVPLESGACYSPP